MTTQAKTRIQEIQAIWEQYQGLYVVGGILIGLLLFPLLELFINDLSELLIGLVPEAIGIGFTVFFLDRIYQRREIENLKRQLIGEARSQSNETAKSAIDWIRREGWLIGDSGLLKDADLVDANLQGANLSNASLERVNLRGANLDGANLTATNLERASLSYANIQHVSLFRVNLQLAHLNEANLKGSTLRDVNLKNANLVEAKLQDAVLSRSDLRGAKLGFAKLQSADLRYTNLEDEPHHRDSRRLFPKSTDNANYTRAKSCVTMASGNFDTCTSIPERRS